MSLLKRHPQTAAQRQASIQNGAKSCGPLTSTGKQHSANNGRRQSPHARLTPLPPTWLKDAADLERELQTEHRPTNLHAQFALRILARQHTLQQHLWTLEITTPPHDLPLLNLLSTLENRAFRQVNRALETLLRTKNSRQTPQLQQNKTPPPEIGSQFRPNLIPISAQTRAAGSQSEYISA